MAGLSKIETYRNLLDFLEPITYTMRLMSTIGKLLKPVVMQVPAGITVIVILTLLGAYNSFAHEGNGLHTHPSGTCSRTAWISKHENGDDDPTGGIGNVAYDKNSNQLTITFCLPASGELKEYEYFIVPSGADIIENIYAGKSNTAPLKHTSDGKFKGSMGISSDTLVNVIARANGKGEVQFELQSDDFDVESGSSTISHEFTSQPNQSNSFNEGNNSNLETNQEITENINISLGIIDSIFDNTHMLWLFILSNIIITFVSLLVLVIIIYNGWSFGHRFLERRKKYHRTTADLEFGNTVFDEIIKAFEEIKKKKYDNIDICRRDCINLLIKIIETCNNEIIYEDLFPKGTKYYDSKHWTDNKAVIKQYNDIINVFINRIEKIKRTHPNLARFDDEKLEEIGEPETNE